MRKHRQIQNTSKFLSIAGALSCLGTIHAGMTDALMYKHPDTHKLPNADAQQAARQKRLRKQERNRKNANISKS